MSRLESLRPLVGHATLLLLFAISVTPAPAQEDGNLLVNGGFDLDADGNGLPDGWSTDPERIVYRETVAFGGDYEIVSKPGAYVLATQEVTLIPGETYTFTFEAKGTGDGAAGALLMQGPDRPEREFSLLWQQPVKPEYNLYARTFTAPNPACRLYLYNVAKTGEVAYRRVELRQGTPDYPLVRGIRFRSLDEPLDAPVETPHFEWARPLAGGAPTVLFTIYNYRSIREHVELAQRLDLDYDVVWSDRAEAASATSFRTQQRLMDDVYDAFVVASDLPEPFRAHFAKALRNGKTVIVLDGQGSATDLFDPRELPEVPADHWLQRDLPGGGLPANILLELRAGEVGAGRAIYLKTNDETSRVWGLEPVGLGGEEFIGRTYAYWEYRYALLARLLTWAAHRDQPIDCDATADAAGLTVTVADLPAGASLELTPRSGREVRFGEPDLRFPAQRITPGQPARWPDGFPAGRAFADVRVLNPAGEVIYFGAVEVVRPQAARFAAPRLADQVVEPGAAVTVNLTVEGAPATLQAKLVDAWGREHANSAQPAAAGPVTVSLSTARTLTAGNKLVVRLVDEAGDELDSVYGDVYVPALNHRQAWDDFHITAWGDSAINGPISHRYNLMMRELGLNGKFHGFLYGAVEDALWPTHSSGARGFWPGSEASEGGVRRSGRLSDPAFYERIDTTLAERIPGWRPFGVAAYSIGDEISLTSRHQIDEVDFSEPSLAAFRVWLRKRYPDLRALNRTWGSDFATFDEVMPLRTPEVRGRVSFAPFVDFRTFMTDEWVRALRYVVDKVEELDPNTRVGHTNTFGTLPFNGADFYKICTIPGFGWGQEYSEAIKSQAQKAVFELWRSFTPDEFPNLGWIGYNHTPAAVAYEPWWLALHGSRGVSYFATNAVDAERSTSWALIHPTQSLTEYSRQVQAALADLRNGCGKALMSTRAEQPEVALLWSHPSMLASWCESGWHTPEPPDTPPFDAYGAWSRSAFNFRLILEDLNVPYRYVAPQQLADPAALEPYKMLILPATCALDAATVAQLRAYQGRGGILVGDINLLKYDEHGSPWRDRDPLTELFAVRATGPTVWADATVATVRLRTQAPMTIPAFGRQPLEILADERCEMLGKHADGTPALITRDRSIYLNTLLLPDQAESRSLVTTLLGAAQISRPVTVTRIDGGAGPTGCSVTRRFNGPIELLGVIRDFRRLGADEADPLPVRIAFGREAQVVDVRTGEQLGEMAQLETTLSGGQARLYALLPYRVRELALEAPATLARGTDLPIEVRLNGDGKIGNHVLHVELRDPAGNRPGGYRFNVTSDEGIWRGTIPLAANDPTGPWQLQVRDVTGGVEVTRPLTINE